MCLICQGATREEYFDHLRRIVDDHGWVTQLIEWHPDQPGWAYTIGLSNGFAHPEVVLLGHPCEGRWIVDDVAEQVVAGASFHAGDHVDTRVGPVRLGAVHGTHLGQGLIDGALEYRARHRTQVPLGLLQIIPPTGELEDLAAPTDLTQPRYRNWNQPRPRRT